MHFEKINKYIKDDALHLPERKTAYSAGYDFEVAEGITVPSYWRQMKKLEKEASEIESLNLSGMTELTKCYGIRPTLVPTGVKVYLDDDYYLALNIRSSLPFKNWLVLANGTGIIDSDYVDNKDNEGHIMFQVINLSPFDINLKKGDRIGQGVILPYVVVDNDSAIGERKGGFGSTT